MWICLMTLQNYSSRLFFANRVSLSCTVSANWWPKGQKKFRRMAVTSPGVGFTNPGVGFTNRRLRKTTRRLVRAISPTMPMAWNCPILRACIRIWFPEKSIHPFTHRMFSTDFHRSCLWRLAFPSVHTGGERLWRVRKTSLHTVKLLKIRSKAAFTPWLLWTLENPTLHTRIAWKSVEKDQHVKGWILFPVLKNVYSFHSWKNEN